jgi:amino acid adenylation domain-containing protein
MVVGTLVELLAERATAHPKGVAYRFLSDGDEQAEVLSYEALYARARAIAAELGRHAAPGECAILLHPPGFDYIAGLFGCLVAGVVAVPAMPPPNSRPIGPLLDLVTDTGARVALASTGVVHRVQKRLAEVSAPALTWLEPPALTGAEPPRLPAPRPDDLAVLQYTSGSTTAPKGVMLTHATLMSNVRMLAEHLGAEPADRIAGWLPPYHDMGLIGTVLGPLYVGCEATLMPPALFLQRPLRWLQAISRYGATISGGPNFAYDLCVRRSTPDERAALDLSSWRVAFSGAERVRRETLQRFAEAFAVAKFRSQVFCPCYGLAEATLGVSFTDVGAGPRFELEANGPSGRPEPGRGLVSNGRPLAGLEVRIVDPETRVPAAAGEEGEIWVRGPSIARGYWRRPELTRSVFQATLAGADASGPAYLRTGDLGFLKDGELYVTGRLKDLIILLGTNHHPEDLEAALDECHPELRSSLCAAFAVEGAEREELTIVVEVADTRDVPSAEIESAVRGAIANRQNLPVDRVVIVGPGGIPRTSSGKVRRADCRALYLAGKLRVVTESKLEAQPLDAAGADPGQTSAIAAMMAELLGLTSVDPDADFLALGGHSLLATQLVARIRDVLEVEVPLRVVFETPTARAISARLGQLSSDVMPPISKRSLERARVLSFSQERMWFLQQVDPSGTAYNVAGGVLLEGPLDVPALERAFRGVLARHEILRTNYVNGAGQAEIVIGPPLPFSLALRDLSHEADPERAAEELGSALAQRPFDLATDTLVRLELYRLGPERHALASSMHHVVSDGWSMGVLLRELLERYAAERAGRAISEPFAAPTYLDYAAWQRRELVPRRFAEEVRYWRKQLAGTTPLELPTDRPRPSRRSSAGAFEPIELDDELVQGLDALAKRNGATLFMVMLAAFDALLHRFTGSTDIVIGTPLANRTYLAAESLVGTLVNTIALRVRFDPDESFLHLLRVVRNTALDAWAHQELPFERLVSELAVARIPGRSPLFDVMFDFQNSPMPVNGAEGLVLRPFKVERRAAQFELSLNVLATELGRLAGFEYSTALFDAATIQRIGRAYLALLGEIVRDPAQAVSRIRLHSESEERTLVELCTRATGAPLLTPLDAALAHAEQTPTKVALTDAVTSLTYAELASRVALLAGRLAAAGVKAGDRVALFLTRSSSVPVAMLATMQVGAAYVPLDPAHPDARLSHVVSDAEPRLFLTERSLLQRAAELAANRACVRVDDPEPVATRAPKLEPGWDRVAYVLYTSGSSGRPKGVAVPVGALANFFGSMAREPGMSAHDRVLSVTTVAFDIAALELLLPLTVGAELHVAPAEVVADGAKLRSLLESGSFTLLQATPSSYRLLLAAGLQKNDQLTALVGGEPLDHALAQELLARFPRVFNMYGPTETTVWSTLRRVSASDNPVPIGAPIDRTSVYVLDRHGALAPLGVLGEICIGGAGVALGYLGKPELTAERFVPDPYARRPLGFGPARMYRTGDVGRLRADGVLECQGRVDQQVKIRGYRVELGEIEACLKQAPGVREAVVTYREVRPGESRLNAYYTSDGAEPPNADALRSYLRRALPEYMVPSGFLCLDAIPLTPNGKVDRAALPLVQAGEDASRPIVPPRTPEETMLAELWGEVLGIEAPSVVDNFFDLGGHSLLAVRILSAIERRTRITLPLAALLAAPTIEELALLLVQTPAGCAEQPNQSVALVPKSSSFLVPIQTQGSGAPIFCVHGAGGNVLNLRALAQRLGPRRPFYGIQAAGVDGVTTPLATIEAMADAYLHELLQVQPHGPYYLAGYCGGGIVAYEMAQRLAARGEETALLALLDAFRPGLPLHVVPVSKRLKDFSEQGPGYLWRGGKRRFARSWNALSASLRVRFHRLFRRAVPHELREFWLMSSFLASVTEYAPAPYARRLTVLRARESSYPREVVGEDLGWSVLAQGGLELYEVPGNHDTLAHEPNVSTLAEILGHCIERAENELSRRSLAPPYAPSAAAGARENGRGERELAETR